MGRPTDRTIRLRFDDDWRVEIAPPLHGFTQVAVFSPEGRQWTGRQPTVEGALELAWRILDEQRLAHELALEAREQAAPIGG